MAKYNPVEQKDWQIAEIAEGEMISFDAMCDKLEIPKDERIPARSEDRPRRLHEMPGTPEEQT